MMGPGSTNPLMAAFQSSAPLRASSHCSSRAAEGGAVRMASISATPTGAMLSLFQSSHAGGDECSGDDVGLDHGAVVRPIGGEDAKPGNHERNPDATL
jgi:hypothetical protein